MSDPAIAVPAFDHLETRARSLALQKRSLLERLHRRRARTLDYRRVFLGSDGQPSVEGAAVLADLIAITRLGTAAKPLASAEELRERASAQAVVQHIIACLDLNGDEVRQIAAKLRETRA